MPSPLGHALIGCATGWLTAPSGPAQDGSVGFAPSSGDATLLQRLRWPLTFAAAGMAPDLDLLVGMHSRYTHSLGAVVIVLGAAWWWLRPRHAQPTRAALAVSLAYGSHLVLDWLASDTSPPIGIMALWPLSNAFYLSPVTVFMGISRKFWLPAAWGQNAVSLMWELLIVVPVTALVITLRRGLGSRSGRVR